MTERNRRANISVEIVSDLRIFVLGAPHVELNCAPVAIRRRKSLALLVYLAFSGARHHRDTLATLFWPDSRQSQARAALRRDLSELNVALGKEWLELERDTAGLRPGYWLDVDQLQRDLDACAAAPESCPERLIAAVDSYRDDFLAGFTLKDCPQFDEWQVFQTESLRGIYAGTLDQLVDLLDGQNEHKSAIVHARRRLALDTLYEPAHRRLMQLYVQTGQQAAALRQYERCCEVLDEELGVPPAPETSELYEQIRAQRGAPSRRDTNTQVEPAQVTVARAEIARTPRHNLPIQTTRFVGREQELADIQARLTDPACRLLTLLGPGGIGKTRLALEAARRQMGSYPDGIHFVQLAPVESPAFVVQALADGLGLVQTNQRDPLEQIIHYVREKTLLLLIDNFEHLLDGVALLGEVLVGSAAAKLLVTSRERLHLKEEWVFDVQGLRYPAGRSEGQANTHLVDYEAGQLFLQTAQRAKAGFVPDENNQEHIARICRLVGGMPLGIELAASWVRLLSCAEISREIAQDLDILTTAWCDVPERHHSIQAVLDHSWKMLATSEQDAFRRLTVFSGNFEREAATAVAGASLPLLLALADKSFLQQTNEGRFGIHELVKQYGSDKLRADPEMWTAMRLQHCRYHAAFLDGRMRALDASPYLSDIEAVFDDMQAAWRYAVENRQLAEIQQLAEGLLAYYRLHSWYRAGSGALALVQQALACFDSDTQDPDQRVAIACLNESMGDLLELRSAHDKALAAFEKALAITADSDHTRRGRLYGKVADVWVLMNQHEQGHEYYTRAESALENTAQRDAAWWVEWLRIETQRMEVYYWQNRPDDMAEIAGKIHPLIEQHGSVAQRVRYLYMLGMIALRRDRYLNSGDAIAYLGEALALSLGTGNLGEIAYRHFSYGFSHLWCDHLDEAETHLQIAREMTEQNGDLTLLARPLTYLAVVYRKRGDIARVREYAAYGLKISEQAKMPQYAGAARAQYAWIAWRTGDLIETRRQVAAAIEDWGGLQDAQSLVGFRWFALFPLLGVALQEENIELAVRCAQDMMAPSQQRLPDELASLLAQAVAAGEQHQWDAVGDLLRQAFQVAQELHYV